MEEQAFHIIGEVDEHDLGLGALEADGADKQPHVALLLREDMLDEHAPLIWRCWPCACGRASACPSASYGGSG